MENSSEGGDNTQLLFDISNLIKDVYEKPVILVTKKDYSTSIYNILCSLYDALPIEDKKKVIDLVVDFHLHWLNAINDILAFQKSLETNLSIKTIIAQFCNYTTDAMKFRFANYQRYMEDHRHVLEPDDQCNLQSDLEIVEEMHTEITHMLSEKIKCMLKCQTDLECKVLANTEAEELLNWLDMICDSLAVKVGKYITLCSQDFSPINLGKPLQRIVEELSGKTGADEPMNLTSESLKYLKNSMVCIIAGHDLQRNKILDKILSLEDRIKHIAEDKKQSNADMIPLVRKKDFLQKTLDNFENTKCTLQNFKQSASIIMENLADEECICEEYYQIRIFNHELPVEKREQLVTELCHVWDDAIFAEQSHQKSLISILSAIELKEEFTDELGTFYVDEHSRKIYKLPETDTLYQLNEHGQLVAVSDDTEHIYFYDECGRYYVHPKTRQRFYKAHATASEYLMDPSGTLIKYKEVRDNMEYFYDNYGRYYVNYEGKHIYRDTDTLSEYENDGFGNLVRIRSQLDLFDPCPGDANVTEEFRYLRDVVGKALRESLGKVLLQRPTDPIKYLSLCLVKYRENIENRDKRAREREELNAEREIIAAEERAAAERAAMEAALLMKGGSEASFDSNLLKYKAANPDNYTEGHSSL